MKGKTHSTEEIIRILRQADGGKTAQSVCRDNTSPSRRIIAGKRNTVIWSWLMLSG
jgi:hypothetical protein